MESLPVMVQGVQSNDPASQLEATTQFRKLLSIGVYASLPVQSAFIIWFYACMYVLVAKPGLDFKGGKVYITHNTDTHTFTCLCINITHTKMNNN